MKLLMLQDWKKRSLYTIHGLLKQELLFRPLFKREGVLRLHTRQPRIPFHLTGNLFGIGLIPMPREQILQ